MKRVIAIAALAAAVAFAGSAGVKEQRTCGSLDNGRPACRAALLDGKSGGKAYGQGLREEARAKGFAWIAGGDDNAKR